MCKIELKIKRRIFIIGLTQNLEGRNTPIVLKELAELTLTDLFR